MHELSLMDGVLTAVRESAEQHRISRVSRVKLVVGKLSMAMPDSLRFAFEVLQSQDEMFKESILEIEQKEVECECKACHDRFVVGSDYKFLCPQCGEGEVEIVAGRELFIDSFEGEED